MRKRKWELVGLWVAFFLLTGCGTKEDNGRVYYMNFKPEQDAQWQELAQIYTEQTGIPVTVLTAASGQYEATLKSEMAKREAPTLFQVNGPVGLEAWEDYCYDLSDTAIAGELISDEFALMDGEEMEGIAYVIESYGIIYNRALLEQAGYTESDIKSFVDLKAVAEDITARSEALGFSAFTSAGMDSSSDWRFKTHLANLPIYYEYKERDIDRADAINGTYLDNYREIWDLYINNSATPPALLSTKTGDDAIAEFVTGRAVFYQNGTWAYGDVSAIGDDNLGILPIYIGAAGEETQGLCTGTENYWCVNETVSEKDIQVTLDFLYWCATSEVGVRAMCGTEGAMPSGNVGMGFVTPFRSNPKSENVLVNLANQYVEQGYTPVSWDFLTTPSEQWRNQLGSALTVYAAEQTDTNWDAVVAAFVDNWSVEAAK